MLSAMMCLALNVYHEARGEPWEGQVAVAQVVLHRAKKNPESICKEVYCSGQFSWVHQEPPSPSMKSKAWHDAVAASQYAMMWATHGLGVDFSRGANYYHANHVRPRWGFTTTTIIGDHIFYSGKYRKCGRKNQKH